MPVGIKYKKYGWQIRRIFAWGLSFITLYISLFLFDFRVRVEHMSIKTDFFNTHTMIENYRSKNGNYPQSLDTMIMDRHGNRLYFNKSEYIIFDTSFVYKASESSYTFYLYGLNRKDDGGKGDDMRYDPQRHRVIYSFQNLFRLRDYVYTSGIILAILFFVLGFWPRSRKKMNQESNLNTGQNGT